MKKKKTTIPVAFGEVRQTVNTPTSIVRIMKRMNTPIDVSLGCVDQQEYSLMKILFIYSNDRKEKKEIYKGVGFNGRFFGLLILLINFGEFD